jgi:hypothetical protein
MKISVEMPLKEAVQYLHATEEAHHVLGEAEAAFNLIARLVEGGDYDGHDGIPAVARLASRALANLDERYPDALHNLSEHLKEALPKGGIE